MSNALLYSRQIKEESKKKNLTDDYYSMADMLRDDTKVKPEFKVNEDPKKRERRKNSKMVDENDEDKEDDFEDSDEEEEGDGLSEAGDDVDVVAQKNMRKGKMNQLLKNEKKEQKRVSL